MKERSEGSKLKETDRKVDLGMDLSVFNNLIIYIKVK